MSSCDRLQANIPQALFLAILKSCQKHPVEWPAAHGKRLISTMATPPTNLYQWPYLAFSFFAFLYGNR
jgi:hypothetical protein